MIFFPVISLMIESPIIRVSGSSAFCEMGPCWLEVAVVDACAARLRGDWFLFHLCPHRPSGHISGLRGSQVADACAARLHGDWFLFRLCPHRPSGRISGLRGAWVADACTARLSGDGFMVGLCPHCLSGRISGLRAAWVAGAFVDF